MDFKTKILNKISEIIGLEVDELEPEMHLEAELGIDSIKMMALWNNLLALLPNTLAAEIGNMSFNDTVTAIETLGDLVRFFSEKTEEGGTSEDSEVDSEERSASDRKALECGVEITSLDHLDGEILEMFDTQYFFLFSNQLINSSSLCITTRLKGQLNLKAANQAWGALVKRHISLQTCFYIPETATSYSEFKYLRLNNPVPPEIEHTDLSEKNIDEAENHVSVEFKKQLNKEWALNKWPLHRFSVISVRPDEHVLFYSNEHIISDGMGNQTLIKEFLELYHSFVSKSDPDLPEPASLTNYRKLVQTINTYTSGEEESELKAYLKKQGRDPYLWNLKDSAPDYSKADFSSKKFQLEKSVTSHIICLTKKLKVTTNAILVAAYVMAIDSLKRLKTDPIVQIPTSGVVYPEIDAENIIGGFAQNLSLSFKTKREDEDISQYIKRIHQEIQSAIAWGFDRSQTSMMGSYFKNDFVLDKGQIPEYLKSTLLSSTKSNLYLPFTGRTNIEGPYGGLEVMDYHVGTTNVSGALDVSHKIHRGELVIFANFDSCYFDEQTIDKLMERYLLQLSQFSKLEVRTKSKNGIDVIHNQKLTDFLCETASKVLQRHIDEKDINKDLESEFGLDSLDRIKLITKIITQYREGVDRNRLFGSRTIHDMAIELYAAFEAKHVPVDPCSKQKKPEASGILYGNENTRKSGFKFDSDLPDIPYLHIAKQAGISPDLDAVVTDNRSITYAELDLISNRVARFLTKKNTGPGDLVAIYCSRGIELITGILGILKSGAGYVPIDPDYPTERVRYILNHTKTRVLLLEDKMTGQVASALNRDMPLDTLLYMDETVDSVDNVKQSGVQVIEHKVWNREDDSALSVKPDPEDMMVVLYTSGSTGTPKGVALSHKGFMNRLVWHQNVFQLEEKDRIAQKTSCCFDISIWEIFWPIMVGATIYPVEKETVKNPWQFADWMKAKKISMMHFIPSMFGEFFRAHLGEKISLPDLKWILMGGEPLPAGLVQNWFDTQGTDIRLAFLYGPTEASIDVTCHLIEKRPESKNERIPIGQAIDNTYILLLDQNRHPVEKGEPGEMFIGGVQLANGYLFDIEKTEKSFIKNTFDHIPCQTLYKTGDLAIEKEDGSYEYRGRVDHQVKIRGFRIELGEIESVLLTHPKVEEAVVLAIRDTEQLKLIAWLGGEETDKEELKQFIGKKLAEYMIPHHMIWKKQLPKNTNGKLDRTLLTKLYQEQKLNPEQTDDKPDTLELSPAQKWAVSYFDEPCLWGGYSRFEFKMPLLPNLFTTACNILIKRHPALRTKFFKTDGVWKKQVLNDVDFEPSFYDGTGVDKTRLNSEIERLLDNAYQNLDLGTAPLMDILVVKCGDSHFDISIISHHIIADMVSGNLIFKELWDNYNALVQQQEIAEGEVASSDEMVKKLIQSTHADEKQRYIDYWKEQFPAGEKMFDFPTDFCKGENIEASSKKLSFEVDGEKSKNLLLSAKRKYKASLYHLLLAPLYKLVADRTGQQKVVFSHRMHGRDTGLHSNVFNSIDNYAINFPLGIHVNKDQETEDTVKSITDAFSNVPMNGLSYDWLSGELPFNIYPDNKLTPIRINYLGNIPRIKDSGLFSFDPEKTNRRLSSPKQKRTTLIEIWLSTVNNKVVMEIGYSDNFYRSETIQNLGETYIEMLSHI